MRWDNLQYNTDTKDHHGDLDGDLAPEPLGDREDAQRRKESPDILQTDHDRIHGGLVRVSKVLSVRFELQDTPYKEEMSVPECGSRRRAGQPRGAGMKGDSPTIPVS